MLSLRHIRICELFIAIAAAFDEMKPDCSPSRVLRANVAHGHGGEAAGQPEKSLLRGGEFGE
jgi:hypothetical protein